MAPFTPRIFLNFFFIASYFCHRSFVFMLFHRQGLRKMWVVFYPFLLGFYQRIYRETIFFNLFCSVTLFSVTFNRVCTTMCLSIFWLFVFFLLRFNFLFQTFFFLLINFISLWIFPCLVCSWFPFHSFFFSPFFLLLLFVAFSTRYYYYASPPVCLCFTAFSHERKAAFKEKRERNNETRKDTHKSREEVEEAE